MSMARRSAMRPACVWSALLFMILLLPVAARAQCFPVARSPGTVVPVVDEAAPALGSVRLTFLGHSMFLLETSGGARAITDYNGTVLLPEPPDIVTMNNAHESHYTDFVPDGIRHVLRGWDPDGGVALHDLTFRDLRVRNVPTNVREFGGVRVNGNSIFVF